MSASPKDPLEPAAFHYISIASGTEMTGESVYIFSQPVSAGAGITAALITAGLALIGVAAKIFYDYYAGKSSIEFQSAERRARQTFEEEQRTASQEFQNRQIDAAREAETRTKKDLQAFIVETQRRDNLREKRVSLLHTATMQVRATIDDVAKLVQFSPAYDDLTMISETAKVLDSLASLKLAVTHLSLPEWSSSTGQLLLDKVTKILLTMSPDKFVREKIERIARLKDLVDQLRQEGATFEAHYRQYEESPGTFEHQTACSPPVDLAP